MLANVDHYMFGGANILDVKVYFHPTCPTSIKLMKLLVEEGLNDKVVLVDTSKNPYPAFKKGILSIPSVEIDGHVVVQGVLFDEIPTFILEGRPKTIPYASLDELIDRFLRGVLESFAVTS